MKTWKSGVRTIKAIQEQTITNTKTIHQIHKVAKDVILTGGHSIFVNDEMPNFGISGPSMVVFFPEFFFLQHVDYSMIYLLGVLGQSFLHLL